MRWLPCKNDLWKPLRTNTMEMKVIKDFLNCLIVLKSVVLMMPSQMASMHWTHVLLRAMANTSGGKLNHTLLRLVAKVEGSSCCLNANSIIPMANGGWDRNTRMHCTSQMQAVLLHPKASGKAAYS